MKRYFISLFAITLLFSLVISPALISAQDDEGQTVQPISGRYEFTAPSDWIVDTNPGIFADSGDVFMSSEIVWVASDEATLQVTQSDFFDIFEADQVEGAFFVSLLIPHFLIGDMGSMSADDFGDMVAESLLSETDDKKIQEDLELRGISGKSYRVIDKDENAWWLVVLIDDADNILLWIGYSPSNLTETLQTSLESLIFHDFTGEDLYSTEDLSMSAEVILDYATLNVPRGWWYGSNHFDGQPVFISELGADFDGDIEEHIFSSLTNGGIFFTSISLDRNDFDEDAYNADGMLSLEKLLRVEIDEAINIHTTEWNAPGLGGLQFTFDIETEGVELFVQGVILDADSEVHMVFGAVGSQNAETYMPLMTAILDSIQRVE